MRLGGMRLGCEGLGRHGAGAQRATAELKVRELVRTTDPVLISAIEALLNGARIKHMIVDQNMSIMEGSIGIFPRRILVDEDQFHGARRLLEEAGFGGELRPDVR
jgi:Putative prokaryotic signal transducing protein